LTYDHLGRVTSLDNSGTPNMPRVGVITPVRAFQKILTKNRRMGAA